MHPREYPQRPIVGVGGVIIDAGRVVLIQRGRSPLLGEWSIPGGGVEVGEQLRDAVHREVLEETGLVVSVGEIVEVLDRITLDAEGKVLYHFVLIDYFCRVQAGELHAASDASDARWVRPADIPQYKLRPETLQVVQKGFAMAGCLEG
jgi:8-oxo-dGTP diphosphatase